MAPTPVRLCPRGKSPGCQLWRPAISPPASRKMEIEPQEKEKSAPPSPRGRCGHSGSQAHPPRRRLTAWTTGPAHGARSSPLGTGRQVGRGWDTRRSGKVSGSGRTPHPGPGQGWPQTALLERSAGQHHPAATRGQHQRACGRWRPRAATGSVALTGALPDGAVAGQVVHGAAVGLPVWPRGRGRHALQRQAEPR